MAKAKRLTEYQLQIFYNQVEQVMANDPSLRLGQAMYNALQDVSPDLVNEINESSFDPYYDNNKIADFISYITGF